MGQSAGGRKWTTEALGSKRAFMSERGGMDVIHRARWDTLNAWYVSHASIRCSVGQLISSFLSQMQITVTQSTAHVLSSTI